MILVIIFVILQLLGRISKISFCENYQADLFLELPWLCLFGHLSNLQNNT